MAVHAGFHDVPLLVEIHIPPAAEPARSLLGEEMSMAKARVRPPRLEGPREGQPKVEVCSCWTSPPAPLLKQERGVEYPGRVEAYLSSEILIWAGIVPVAGSRRRRRS